MGCSTHTKISIDIRMNTRFAGENLFFRKFARWCFRCYWWEYMKEKTHQKLNISLPKELHAWVVKKQSEENKKSRLSKASISAIIADAVQQIKTREHNEFLMMQETPASKHETAPTARSTVPITYTPKIKRKQ
jgi:hypothetical protein